MKVTKSKRGKVLKISKEEIANLSKQEIIDLYELDPRSAAGVAFIHISEDTSRELAGKHMQPGYLKYILDRHGFKFEVTNRQLYIIKK